MSQIRGDEYDATAEIERIKQVLQQNNHDICALSELQFNETNESLKSSNVADKKFQCQDLMKPPVLKPLLMTLFLVTLVQASGQGSVIFYTSQIFNVSRTFENNVPSQALN